MGWGFFLPIFFYMDMLLMYRIFKCHFFFHYFHYAAGCEIDDNDNSAEMKTNILSDLLQLGRNEDLSPYTRLAVEEENELTESTSSHAHHSAHHSNSTQLAGFKSTTPKIRPPSLSEISFSDGPSKEPEEGWTLSAAGIYCSDYIESSKASKNCLSYVGTS